MSFMTPAQARLYIPALTGTGEAANLTLLIDRREMVFAIPGALLSETAIPCCGRLP